MTVHKAISHIITLGQSTPLAKLDVKGAFYLLPVHPANRHLVEQSNLCQHLIPI